MRCVGGRGRGARGGGAEGRRGGGAEGRRGVGEEVLSSHVFRRMVAKSKGGRLVTGRVARCLYTKTWGCVTASNKTLA